MGKESTENRHEVESSIAFPGKGGLIERLDMSFFLCAGNGGGGILVIHVESTLNHHFP